jgi:hypothetical protein
MELTMHYRHRVLTLALLFSFALNLIPVGVMAQSAATDAKRPALSVYGVRCRDQQCMLIVNAAGLQTEVAVPARNPLRFDLPAGNLGFLSGAGVEISDQLTLNLPVGAIQIRNGDFLVGVDAEGNVQRLRGKADTVLPALTLPNNLRIGGDFAAEFGYDYGAELGAVGRLLNPEARYFYVRVGDGITLDTALLDENGESTPITVGVPENESTTIIVDPENQLLYIDGRFNLSQVLRLALVASTLGIDVAQLPMLAGVTLPLRSTVGVAALFSREPERNFVQINSDLSIQGGPLAQLLQLKDAPLALDSTIRIDNSGMLLQGIADARVAPQTLLETGGALELFVPFERLRDAYVRVGGKLSVPVLGIAADNEAMLGGAQAENAGGEGASGEAQLSWWGAATSWIGSAASNTASAVAEGTQVSVNAVQEAVDVALQSAGATLPTAPSVDVGAATGSLLSGATEGVACSVLRAQQLWCETTRLCKPPPDDPACASVEGEGQ